MTKMNVVPTDEFKTVGKLADLAMWLEDSRGTIVQVIQKPVGAPCRATALQAIRDISYEFHQWLLYLPK